MNKTSLDKLQDHSEFLAALLESTNEAIVACDANGVLSYFNKKSLEIHGLPAHPILPEEWAQHYDLYHTDGVTLMRKEELPLFRALNGERVENVEIIIKRKDKNPVLMSCNGRPLFDSQGKKTGAMATMHDITEARKANDELNSAFETSESRFKTIFDQAPFSIQILATDGRTLQVNPAWKKTVGLTEDFIQNFILKEYNILNDPLLEENGVISYLKKGFAGEVTPVPEVLYDPSKLGLPGHATWLEAVVYPLKDSRGNVREVVLIHNDVTEQHAIRSERESLLSQLSLERNRFEQLVQQMPAGVLVADAPDGKLSFHNRQAEKILGEFFASENVEEYAHYRTFHTDGREYLPHEQPLARSLTNGEIINAEEIEIRRPDGTSSFISLNGAPIRDNEGKIAGSVVIATDISEKKASENAQRFLAHVTSLLITTLDYDEIIEQVATAAIPYMADGCMVDVLDGKVIKRLITKHIKPEIEMLLQEMCTTFAPTLNSPHPSSRVIRTGEPELLSKLDLSIITDHTVNANHIELINRIGMRSHIAVPLKIRGKIVGALNFFISTDRALFTEQDVRTAQELARRAAIAIHNARLYSDAQAAIRQRDDFISIASHELKTPITSLKLLMEVVSRTVGKLLPTDTDVQYVMKATHNSKRQLERLAHLVEDMLDISRISTGKLTMDMRRTDLSALVNEVMERFTHQLEHLKVKLDCHIESKIQVMCDAFRLEQVVTNLMTNAIRYGGFRPIEVTLTKIDGKAILKVKDNGLGIDKSDHERIFQRFERAISSDYNGLGLGLYITRQIVNEHDGVILVDSQLGQGSTFTVELTAL